MSARIGIRFLDPGDLDRDHSEERDQQRRCDQPEHHPDPDLGRVVADHLGDLSRPRMEQAAGRTWRILRER
jgi:hypothetical protein